MDTRTKIVSLDTLSAALGSSEWIAVAAAFDPLTLAQAEYLAALASHGMLILAVVDPNPDCLLPAEARAILLAALRTVRLVVIAPSTLLPGSAKLKIVEDKPADQQRSQSFAEHVRSRQTGR